MAKNTDRFWTGLMTGLFGLMGFVIAKGIETSYDNGYAVGRTSAVIECANAALEARTKSEAEEPGYE